MYTLRYRGFESLPLCQIKKAHLYGGPFLFGREEAHSENSFRKNAGKLFLDAKAFTAHRRSDAHGCASATPLPAHHENKQDPPITSRPFLFGREEAHGENPFQKNAGKLF